MRFLLLTVRGRKTGKARTTPLLYGRDGTTYVLIASKGGLPEDPVWYRNLCSNPEVEIRVGSQRIACRARTASAAEKPRLWQLMVANYKDYDNYQAKTSRIIPVVILQPVQPAV